MRDFFFYGLCAVLLGLAGVTVLSRNLFRSALGLLGVLLCTAVLFLLLQAEMVALVQVMVYIGGIMIFVLYAVLLTSELGGRMASPSPLKIGLAVVVAAVALGMLAGLAKKAGGSADRVRAESPAGSVAAGANIASMKSMGERLLDPRGFLVPFELISVLLLAAMVGAIAVAREAAVVPGAGAGEGGGGKAASAPGQGRPA
ncbi:MAG: nuoJ 2 [Fibrobacteres bacterium]|nr:nuoJ 2 [Fibrobacterota bacterium]